MDVTVEVRCGCPKSPCSASSSQLWTPPPDRGAGLLPLESCRRTRFVMAEDAAAKADQAIKDNEQAQKAHDALSPGFQAPLFGCLGEGPVPFLSACCCPMIVLADVQAQMDNRECTPFDCLCGAGPYALRQRLRSQYGMEYAPPQDLVVSFCCCCGVGAHQTAVEFSKRSGKAPDFVKMPDRFV